MKNQGRMWSDGWHEDATRENELRRELEHEVKLCTEKQSLVMVNDWLAVQAEKPWKVEDYKELTTKRAFAVGGRS